MSSLSRSTDHLLLTELTGGWSFSKSSTKLCRTWPAPGERTDQQQCLSKSSLTGGTLNMWSTFHFGDVWSFRPTVSWSLLLSNIHKMIHQYFCCIILLPFLLHCWLFPPRFWRALPLPLHPCNHFPLRFKLLSLIGRHPSSVKLVLFNDYWWTDQYSLCKTALISCSCVPQIPQLNHVNQFLTATVQAFCHLSDLHAPQAWIKCNLLLLSGAPVVFLFPQSMLKDIQLQGFTFSVHLPKKLLHPVVNWFLYQERNDHHRTMKADPNTTDAFHHLYWSWIYTTAQDPLQRRAECTVDVWKLPHHEEWLVFLWCGLNGFRGSCGRFPWRRKTPILQQHWSTAIMNNRAWTRARLIIHIKRSQLPNFTIAVWSYSEAEGKTDPG